MKRLLITGANGFLGQHLVEYFLKADYRVIATGRGASRLRIASVDYLDVDITEKDQVDKLLRKAQPDIIIHNAALSKPDECENNKELCLKVNVDATRYLISANCDHFIYLSTDFVFGEGGPHSESNSPAPLNFYGESKLDAERLVAAAEIATTIVRPVFIYGEVWPGMRPSFLHWVKANLEKGTRIKVVSDQLRTPTYAGDICKGIEAIISRKATGDYNLAGKDILSPYQMAVKTAEVAGLDASLIEEVTVDTFPEPVRRAKRSGLKISKARLELDYEPVTFEEGIRLTFAQH